MPYIRAIRYSVENREYPQNTQNILFGYFWGLPGKILKNAPGNTQHSQQILKKYSQE